MIECQPFMADQSERKKQIIDKYFSKTKSPLCNVVSNESGPFRHNGLKRELWSEVPVWRTPTAK